MKLSLPQAASLRPADAADAEDLFGCPVTVGGEMFDNDGDYLEHAVLGGQVPHLEGVAIALAGYHLIVQAEVERCLDGGVDGDAIGWCSTADDYRGLVAQLEQQIMELELRRATIEELPCRRSEDQNSHRTARDSRRRAEQAALRRCQVIADRHTERDIHLRYAHAAAW